MSAADRFAAWSRPITTVALGKLLGVDPSYVSHLRAGRRTPSLKVAVAIERLTATWEHGPIRPDEWLRPSSTEVEDRPTEAPAIDPAAAA